MRRFNRRDFLRISSSASALLAAAAVDGTLLAQDKPKEKPAAPKKKTDGLLRVAVVGVHGRGMSHVGGFLKNPYTTVTTICDCDSAVIAGAMKAVATATGKEPKFEQDIRKLVEDKDIDIITIATPNHWHSLASIWAMEHGKDVYVEKPVSHNVHEGRVMVETARKTGKICQAGTQSRSAPGLRDSIEYIRSGKLGKISVSRGLCYKPRGSIGKVDGDQQPPSTMDYDLWCGPAPYKLPHRKTKFGTVHYDWHWIWDYGNGDLGNQGIHEMDKARWGLGKMTLPKSVMSVGGRFGYIDDGETANTQICVFDYGDSELIFEVRGLNTKDLKGAKVGNIYYGEKGILVCPNYGSGIVYDLDGKVIQKFSGGGDQLHFDNFVDAVRARKPEMLNGHILEGHLSSALCHLGNISYRLGTLVPFSKSTQAFGDDKEAAETMTRMVDHLKDNKVPLDQTEYHLGRKLVIEPKTESFVKDKEADAMLFREYRKGFEVPEKV
ncbi:MAG TPA: Gfo/Idh/MocA family oxidoreductase [Gemmataceae bacterium]|nr:Gfo/Idh/MocA family oxidoreductase [Gemmataceae bacterium]